MLPYSTYEAELVTDTERDCSGLKKYKIACNILEMDCSLHGNNNHEGNEGFDWLEQGLCTHTLKLLFWINGEKAKCRNVAGSTALASVIKELKP